MENETLPNVFIHGSFANSKSWRRIIDITGQKNSITINLPGHGDADDPSDFSDPTFEPEFQVIKDALERRGVSNQPIHVIGHSFGGVVAMAMLFSEEFKIKKITLFEPVAVGLLPIFDEENAQEIVDEFVEDYQNSYDQGETATCSKVIDFWGGNGSFSAMPDHIQKTMIPLTQNNIRHWTLCKKMSPSLKNIRDISIAVTLISGGRSNNIAHILCRNLHKNITDSEFYIIENASHFMINSHVDECVKILEKI